MKRILSEIWRLRWAIFFVLAAVGVGLIIEPVVLARILIAGGKLTFGFVIAHLIWETFFPFFRLGQAYLNEDERFMGIAIFRAIFIAAWLLAFALVVA